MKQSESDQMVRLVTNKQMTEAVRIIKSLVTDLVCELWDVRLVSWAPWHMS